MEINSFYTVSSTISRHAITNRPPIPTIEELDDIIIGDSYRIVTIDNLPHNFVLLKQTILNEDNVRVGFMILGTDRSANERKSDR